MSVDKVQPYQNPKSNEETYDGDNKDVTPRKCSIMYRWTNFNLMQINCRVGQ